jgi:hypothetical protein
LVVFQKSLRFKDPHKLRRENQQDVRRENQQDVQLESPPDCKFVVFFDRQRSTFKVFRNLLKLLTNSSYFSFIHFFYICIVTIQSIYKKDPHQDQRHVLLPALPKDLHKDLLPALPKDLHKDLLPALPKDLHKDLLPALPKTQHSVHQDRLQNLQLADLHQIQHRVQQDRLQNLQLADLHQIQHQLRVLFSFWRNYILCKLVVVQKISYYFIQSEKDFIIQFIHNYSCLQKAEYIII